MLHTGFRLIAILELLYEKNLSKTEIQNAIFEKYKIQISKETLKLDLNTLKEAGFEIKKGNRGNSFKFSLNKNFAMLKFDRADALKLSLIKDFVLETADFQTVYNIRKFYKKISLFFNEDTKAQLLNFGFYNTIADNIIDAVIEFNKSENTCNITYNSRSGGKKETKAIIKNIIQRNKKVYVDCIFEDREDNVTLRLDNICNITKSTTEIPNKNIFQKPVKYSVKRSYFNIHPIEGNEKIINIDKNKADLELFETSTFFKVQKILSYGKNCLDIKDNNIKKLVIKNLEKALEFYE